MKVLLFNPSAGYQHEYPPLGLLYIGAVLRDAGHEIGFFDEGAKSGTGISFLDYAAKFNPDVCGISVYTTNAFATFNKISSIKKQFPSCITVIGGPHATALPEKTLEECADIDYLVVGEGEYTMKELINALQNSLDVSEVNGLYCRQNGKTYQTPPRDLASDLDMIPFPMYELLQDFHYTFDALKVGKKLATLMTSRGCPYDCAFCSAKAVWRGSFRRRSPENVIREMAWLVDRYGFDEFYFMDDLFAVDRKWLDRFYSLKHENNINAPWKCLGRVDLLSEDDYKNMADGGCYLIQFGVESGDNCILRDINKNITTEQVKRAFREARSAGLNTYGFFIVGHRLDTCETIVKTINFAQSLLPDFLSFFCAVPFPGTKLYDLVPEAFKYEWSHFMYSDWGRNHLPIKLSGVDSNDLLAFEKQAPVQIYSSLSYVLKNILGSKSRKKIFRLKWNVFARHLIIKLSHVVRGTWILSRFKNLDLTDCSEAEAFPVLWKEWLRLDNFRDIVKEHLEVRKRFFEILEKYINISEATNVLEIGCGTAIDSHCLSKSFNNTVFWASDISSEALAVARKSGKWLGSKVRLVKENIEAMSFQSGFFDVVFSQGVMEHFKDPWPALKEQLRILKPNGFLIVDVPQRFNPYTLYKHRQLKKGLWEYGWESEYSSSDLRKIGERLGLIVVDSGGYGYGFFQDYGFSLFPYLLKRFQGGKSIVSSLSRFFLKVLEVFESRWGKYFMQNIVVVYRRK